MEKEISVGCVLFYKNQNSLVEYLIMRKTKEDYWNFPKGRVELGEDHRVTALREVEEETGIPRKCITILDGFKEFFEYSFTIESSKKIINKRDYYFAAKSSSKQIVLSPEHNDACWLPYHSARKKLTYENSQLILDQAHAFITKSMIQ